MNFKQINELLTQNNLSFDQIKNLAKKYDHIDLTKEENLRYTINEIAKMLGKQISVESQNKMIETIKKGDFKL